MIATCCSQQFEKDSTICNPEFKVGATLFKALGGSVRHLPVPTRHKENLAEHKRLGSRGDNGSPCCENESMFRSGGCRAKVRECLPSSNYP